MLFEGIANLLTGGRLRALDRGLTRAQTVSTLRTARDAALARSNRSHELNADLGRIFYDVRTSLAAVQGKN